MKYKHSFEYSISHLQVKLYHQSPQVHSISFKNYLSSNIFLFSSKPTRFFYVELDCKTKSLQSSSQLVHILCWNCTFFWLGCIHMSSTFCYRNNSTYTWEKGLKTRWYALQYHKHHFMHCIFCDTWLSNISSAIILVMFHIVHPIKSSSLYVSWGELKFRSKASMSLI